MRTHPKPEHGPIAYADWLRETLRHGDIEELRRGMVR